LGSMLEVLGSILSSNVTKKRHENEILYDEWHQNREFMYCTGCKWRRN
jgi:hypothetical protein